MLPKCFAERTAHGGAVISLCCHKSISQHKPYSMGRILLNRTEAAALIKEIIETCAPIDTDGFMLMPPNADDVLSHGYQVHLKSSSHQETIPCIKPLVERHNLKFVDEPEKDLIIIYQSLKS